MNVIWLLILDDGYDDDTLSDCVATFIVAVFLPEKLSTTEFKINPFHLREGRGGGGFVRLRGDKHLSTIRVRQILLFFSKSTQFSDNDRQLNIQAKESSKYR